MAERRPARPACLQPFTKPHIKVSNSSIVAPIFRGNARRGGVLKPKTSPKSKKDKIKLVVECAAPPSPTPRSHLCVVGSSVDSSGPCTLAARAAHGARRVVLGARLARLQAHARALSRRRYNCISPGTTTVDLMIPFGNPQKSKTAKRYAHARMRYGCRQCRVGLRARPSP